MNLGAAFGKRRPAEPRPAVPADPDISPGNSGERPAWAEQGTAYWAAVARALDRLPPAKPYAATYVNSDAVPPSDQAATGTVPVCWPTQRGDLAHAGDLVALGNLGVGNRDMVGRIIGGPQAGPVEMVLGDDPGLIGPRAKVDVAQILWLLETERVPVICKDRACYAEPAALLGPEPGDENGGAPGAAKGRGATPPRSTKG